jgi:hypothetical protein
MQREADAYVQVITAGEEPFQIVWASEAWLKLCEYESPQVLGHTLELIQGQLTSRTAVDQLMGAIRIGQPVTLAMINHTRTGKAFSHTLRVEPLRDSRGNVQCFQATSAAIDTSVTPQSAQTMPQGEVGATTTLEQSGGMPGNGAHGGGGGGGGGANASLSPSKTEGSMKRTASELSISGLMADVRPTQPGGRAGSHEANELQISEMLDLLDGGGGNSLGASPALSGMCHNSKTPPPSMRLDAPPSPRSGQSDGLEMLTFPPSRGTESPRRTEPVEGGVAEMAQAQAQSTQAAAAPAGGEGAGAEAVQAAN